MTPPGAVPRPFPSQLPRRRRRDGVESVSRAQASSAPGGSCDACAWPPRSRRASPSCCTACPRRSSRRARRLRSRARARHERARDLVSRLSRLKHLQPRRPRVPQRVHSRHARRRVFPRVPRVPSGLGVRRSRRSLAPGVPPDARPVVARSRGGRLSTRARGGASTNESRHFSDLESFPLARARDARKTRGRRGNVRERVSHRARSRARDEGASASARVGEG